MRIVVQQAGYQIRGSLRPLAELGGLQPQHECLGAALGRRERQGLDIQIDAPAADQGIVTFGQVCHRRWQRIELDPQCLLGLVHQRDHLVEAQRRCAEHVVRRPRLELQPERNGLLAERGSGQDRQLKDLRVAIGAEGGQVVQAAAHGIHGIAGQPDNQVDLDADSGLPQGTHATLERGQVDRPVHQTLGLSVDRLQADFDLREIGCLEPIGQAGVDAFRPQFAEIGELPLRIPADQQFHEITEIRTLVQRGIEEDHFLDAPFGGVSQIVQHAFRRDGVDPVVALRIVTEPALEDAAANRLQEQHPLVRGVQRTVQVRRRDLVECGQRHA